MFSFSSDFFQISYLFRVWFISVVLVSESSLFFKLFLIFSFIIININLYFNLKSSLISNDF